MTSLLEHAYAMNSCKLRASTQVGMLWSMVHFVMKLVIYNAIFPWWPSPVKCGEI